MLIIRKGRCKVKDMRIINTVLGAIIFLMAISSTGGGLLYGGISSDTYLVEMHQKNEDIVGTEDDDELGKIIHIAQDNTYNKQI